MIYMCDCYDPTNPCSQPGIRRSLSLNPKTIGIQRVAVLLLSLILAIAPDSMSASEPTVQSSSPMADLADLPVDILALIPIEAASGASRYDQQVTRAPSSVSIVTAEEIKMLGYRTLAEILRGLGGIYVTADRNYSYLGMRGFGRPGD